MSRRLPIDGAQAQQLEVLRPRVKPVEPQTMHPVSATGAGRHDVIQKREPVPAVKLLHQAYRMVECAGAQIITLHPVHGVALLITQRGRTTATLVGFRQRQRGSVMPLLVMKDLQG